MTLRCLILLLTISDKRLQQRDPAHNIILSNGLLRICNDSEHPALVHCETFRKERDNTIGLHSLSFVWNTAAFSKDTTPEPRVFLFVSLCRIYFGKHEYIFD